MSRFSRSPRNSLAKSWPGAPGQDFAKLFRGERENLDIVEYSWVCEGVEERLLDKFGHKA